MDYQTIRDRCDTITALVDQKLGSQAHLAQMLVLGEEAGEAVGAYRRWQGLARRTGTSEEFFDELADVLITAMVACRQHGRDPLEVMAVKLTKIEERGGR